MDNGAPLDEAKKLLENYSSFYVKLLYNEGLYLFSILPNVFIRRERGRKPEIGMGVGVATISKG